MRIRNCHSFEQLKNYQSIKLSTFIQDIHQAGRNINTSTSEFIQPKSYSRPCLKKMEQQKFVNHLYQSYQYEKKAVQQGLLTLQHLNKYLQPRKRHFDLKKDINFLKKTKFQTCIQKLRAANIILNASKGQQQKYEIIQETIECKKNQKDDIEFIQKMNECQVQQRMKKLLKFKTTPLFIDVNQTNEN
ncbi:unnamed protein product [Paramecium pentaurelia]|uniref:Uncharacterized protein n=1 Tax=Paramecium pentaurelia TaxID=43138 RepID=A0A8S1SH92_9CILI|nr:unnamed protein product [Paramecium pentaurelia]